MSLRSNVRDWVERTWIPAFAGMTMIPGFRRDVSELARRHDTRLRHQNSTVPSRLMFPQHSRMRNNAVAALGILMIACADSNEPPRETEAGVARDLAEYRAK